MTTRTAIDRRVYRRGQTERADLADEVAMVFRRRFGAQGGAFLRTMEASLANATVVPAEVGDLVAAAWGQASAQSSDAGVRRIRAVLLEAQRRGHAEVLRELAEAAGVNVRNRRQYRRFLRSLGRGNLTLDQRAALARISSHVARLIAQVDDTLPGASPCWRGAARRPARPTRSCGRRCASGSASWHRRSRRTGGRE